MPKAQLIHLSVDKHPDNRICSNCIEESFLSDLVEEKGKRRKCSYCGNTTRTISVEELADRIQTVLEQFYQRTSDNPDSYQSARLADKESDYWWTRDGEEITDVIENDVEIPRKAAEDVQEILQDRFSSRSSDEIGEETEFSDDSHYEYVGVGSQAWEEKWDEFEYSLKKETRYFNQLGKEYLDDVFKDIIKLKTIGGNPIMLVGPGQAMKAVYRARVFLSEESLKQALSNIVDHLGSPPPSLAKAGRMNATGISVFYGATDDHTALAEVRPPVGSKVAIAKFKFTRELRLLNLMELKKIRVKGSLFNEAYADLLSRIQFLNQLCEKMTLPVMPGQENTEYLVTQAIADYLSIDGTINLDGIVFPSIHTKTGSNIVLFHKASKVIQREMPAGTEVSVRLWEYSDEGRYPWFSVSEEVPRNPVSKTATEIVNDLRLTSLAILVKSIKIHFINEVQYTSEAHDLFIHRYKKVDLEEMKRNINW